MPEIFLQGNNAGHHSLYQSDFNVAEYRDQTLHIYQGNPLIEALPEILPAKTAAKLLQYDPPFSLSELDLAPELKIHLINGLEELVYPLPEAVSFESIISQRIRWGYRAHNPLNPATWRHRYQLTRNKKPGLPTGHIKSTASSAMLHALSGMGKSTMAETVLNLYPQVIRHNNYKGKNLGTITQIVYIKISIPYDGLLSGLCLSFFRAVDEILGTTYLSQHQDMKIDLMLMKMEQIAANYFVGVIVIDELQNLNFAKSGGASKVLNYFRTLIDFVGIPLVLIGTYASTDLFRKGLQESRRATNAGIIDILRPKSPADPYWNDLLDVIEKYQWFGTGKCKYSEPIRNKIYYLTQGITDFTVRLVMHAQKMAIEEGKETLTVNLLQRASDRHFRLLLPAIAALRSNDPIKMMMFDDLVPPKTEKQIKEEYLLTRDPVPSRPNSENAETKPVEKISPESVGPTSTPSGFTDKKAKQRTPKSKKAEPVDETFEEGDLRNIPKGLTPYDALKAQGLIYQASDDISLNESQNALRKF